MIKIKEFFNKNKREVKTIDNDNLILFRAWDKSLNRLIYINDIGWYSYSRNIDNLNVLKDHIFMQYTNVKDKNNKKIYEGDIIEFNCEYSGEYGIGIIEKWKTSFVVKWIKTAGLNDMFTLMFYTQCPKYLKVLGNIYENKDILDED